MTFKMKCASSQLFTCCAALVFESHSFLLHFHLLLLQLLLPLFPYPSFPSLTVLLFPAASVRQLPSLSISSDFSFSNFSFSQLFCCSCCSSPSAPFFSFSNFSFSLAAASSSASCLINLMTSSTWVAVNLRCSWLSSSNTCTTE